MRRVGVNVSHGVGGQGSQELVPVHAHAIRAAGRAEHSPHQPHAHHAHAIYRGAAPCADLGRFFINLRGALGADVMYIAARLQTDPRVILALEAGQLQALPAWPEVQRVVLTYTAAAGLDGRPVLAALAETMRWMEAPVLALPPPSAPASEFSDEAEISDGPPQSAPAPRPRTHRSAAASAKRLPQAAMRQVRERPQRALYAMSLPLVLVMLAMNSSAVAHALSPLRKAVQPLRQYFLVEFAPVREGLRWIEVDDPRSRRGDKLRIAGGSD